MFLFSLPYRIPVCASFSHTSNTHIFLVRIAMQDFRTGMQAAYERCGFMGERVIGFAYKKIPARRCQHTRKPPLSAAASVHNDAVAIARVRTQSHTHTYQF
jgi:hypothetical protein